MSAPAGVESDLHAEVKSIHIQGSRRARAGATVTLSREGWRYDTRLTPDEARRMAAELVRVADALAQEQVTAQP